MLCLTVTVICMSPLAQCWIVYFFSDLNSCFWFCCNKAWNIVCFFQVIWYKKQSGQSNLTQGRIAVRGRTRKVQSYSSGQVVLMCTHQRQIQNTSLGPAESTSQTVPHRFKRFCAHGRGQRVPVLYNGPLLFSLKIANSHGDLDLRGLPSNTWFLGSTRIHDRDRQTPQQWTDGPWTLPLRL